MIDDQNELFIVVDEQDNILGYRSRYDCHHDKTLIHRSIGIAIYNDKGEILLQKRSNQKDTHPGKYSMSVGGHVTKGQSYEEAAYREMLEELGIKSELTFAKNFLSRSDVETEMVSLYTTTYNGPFHIAKDEVEEVCFFTKEAITKLQDKITPASILELQQLKIA